MCSGDSVYFNRICIDKVRLQSVYTIAITHTIHTPTQDDLCGMFESCARCWPMNCTSGDCQPRGLEEICEST